MSGKYIVALLASATCMAAPVVEAGYEKGVAVPGDVQALLDGSWKDASAAAGGYEGNDTKTKVRSLLDENPFQDFDISGLDWDFDKTEAGSDAGPFNEFSESNSGILTFDKPQTGPFVISLKAGNFYSLYYFEDTFTNIKSIKYNTKGAAFKSKGPDKGPGLSHASLFTPVSQPPPGSPVVPTPTAALGTGLLLAGLAMRRRRRD